MSNESETGERSDIPCRCLLGWQGVFFAPKTGETFLLCLPRQMNLIVRCRYNTLRECFQTDIRDNGVITPYFPFHGNAEYPSDMFQKMPAVPTQWPNDEVELPPNGGSESKNGAVGG